MYMPTEPIQSQSCGGCCCRCCCCQCRCRHLRWAWPSYPQPVWVSTIPPSTSQTTNTVAETVEHTSQEQQT